jgi:hypothetical protein
MNDFDIDPSEYVRLRRDAERMRSEALRALLIAAWTGMTGLGASIVKGVRAWRRGDKLNMSVPAPHH